MEVYFIKERSGRLKESPTFLEKEEMLAWAEKTLGDFWRDDYQEASEEVSLWLKRQGSLHIAAQNVTRCKVPMLGNNYALTKLAMDRSNNGDLPLCKVCFNLPNEEHVPIGELGMSFDTALELLGITEFKQRIVDSNSHGEMFHIQSYFVLAKGIVDKAFTKEAFSSWFRQVVKFAEENWKRPESVFQHIFSIFMDNLEENMKEKTANTDTHEQKGDSPSQ